MRGGFCRVRAIGGVTSLIEVVENAWQSLRQRACIEDVRLHDLRHTQGTYAGQSGANAFTVRDLLRHATVTMTGRYANFDADPVREIANVVNSRIAAGLAGTAEAEVIPPKPTTPKKPAS
jgi:integrase